MDKLAAFIFLVGLGLSGALIYGVILSSLGKNEPCKEVRTVIVRQGGYRVISLFGLKSDPQYVPSRSKLVCMDEEK